MVNWQYNPEIEPIEPGRYRVRIEKAEETQSRSGFAKLNFLYQDAKRHAVATLILTEYT